MQLRSWAARGLVTGAAGLLQALSVASPQDGNPRWWLQILSLAVLCRMVQRPTPWPQAVALGWIFGLVWLSASFWWLFISMHVHGGLAAPVAGTAVVLLAAFLALYYGVAVGVFACLTRDRYASDAFLFFGVWLGAEVLRGSLFTGFPWAGSGYAHVEGPLAAFASWVGVYGISALSALLAFLVAQLTRPPRTSRSCWMMASAGASVLGVGYLLGSCSDCRNPSGQSSPLRVALLQGNISQDEKFDARTGIPLALEWYAQQVRDSSADLVVTPETAIPILAKNLPPTYIDTLQAALASSDRAALVGLPMATEGGGYTNSVVGIGAAAPGYRYDKHHLVPFGEFVPAMFGWFTRMMNMPLGDFSRGGTAQPSFLWKDQRLAPNICYEDLFGEELAVRFREAALAPTILVNLSNIAWFGNTVAIDQHLNISRMRAMEFRRPVLRATNTGATAAIDSYGRVTAMLPPYTRGVLEVEVRGESGVTAFAWWNSRFALWPYWGLVLAALWSPLRLWLLGSKKVTG